MTKQRQSLDMLDKLAREQREAIERYAAEIRRQWQERGYEKPPEPEPDPLDLGRYRRRDDRP
jgi:hypothetical protein